ncbi:MAG: hypothetical protein FVQ80_07185 [Planctomycetes bacterium]|nr:hypothetical protein [Planctomycetota bacterium]
MTCWQVNLISVEFKVGNIDYLKKALTDLNINYSSHDNTIINTRGILFKLEEGQVETQALYIGELNKIKRQYSKVVVEDVAKKKRWVIKNKGQNKMELRRY